MDLPVKSARFLLPKKEIDLTKWAVIACDQHTSDIDYWEKLSRFVGHAPSALPLIFPEVYLGKGEEETRVKNISAQMDEYLKNEIFQEMTGMVLVKRWQASNGKVREGILLAVDLEHYSFQKGDRTLIRASEGTVLERLPPRVNARKQCALELPHIMLLYDDPDFTVHNALRDITEPVLYDFDLNMNGGHLQGIHIKSCSNVLDAFAKLLVSSKARYGEELLFAVGDGNHSLAAAKQVYEDAQKAGRGEECRYVLCEAVNLFDSALCFEPIHRLAFVENPSSFCAEIAKNMPIDPIEAVAYTDEFIKSAGVQVDYIHGDTHLKELAKKCGAAPISLKAMDKAGFFPYIIKNGSLPKKTFSMGEAEDKRYYLEAAHIR